VALRPHSRAADWGYVKFNWWFYALAFIPSATLVRAMLLVGVALCGFVTLLF
jgi:hypothetical protein